MRETILKSGAFIGCTQIKNVIYNGLQYSFNKFSDSINHVGNPFPYAVRELIASVYSCFEIADHQTITAYLQDATRITIPEDVEEIGQDVFANHVRLSEINIPPSVKIFGPRAFFMTAWIENQRKLSGMVIVNSELLDGAFCKGKVLIQSGVRRLGLTTIPERAFFRCKSLKKVIIPKSVRVIEAEAFAFCEALEEVVLSKETVVADGAFGYCRGVRMVIIQNN